MSPSLIIGFWHVRVVVVVVCSPSLIIAFWYAHVVVVFFFLTAVVGCTPCDLTVVHQITFLVYVGSGFVIDV